MRDTELSTYVAAAVVLTIAVWSAWSIITAVLP